MGEEENRSLFFLSRARKERKEKENNVCVQATFCGGRKQALTKFSFFFFLNLDMVGRLSPPQRLLLGIPKKIAKIEKNRKRAGDDGKRGKKRKTLSDQDIFSSWLSL